MKLYLNKVMLNFKLQSFESIKARVPRKFKGGICCGSHLAVTYIGELLHLWSFS